MTIRLMLTRHEGEADDKAVVFSNAEQRMMLVVSDVQFEMLDQPEFVDVDIHAVPPEAVRVCADCRKDVSGGYWTVPHDEGSVRLCNDCRRDSVTP